MKPEIHKVGTVWVVEATSPRRKVRVQSWEEALRVVAGPTGDESRCQRCDRPMSSMPNRPIGVYHQRTLLHCHVCVSAYPSLVEVGRRERVSRMRARREAEAEAARAAEEARQERVIPAEALTRDPGLARWLSNRNRRLARTR